MTDAEKALDALNKLTNPHIFLVQIQKKELAEIISKALQRVDKVQGLVDLLRKHKDNDVHILENCTDKSDIANINYLRGSIAAYGVALAAFGADDLGVEMVCVR